MTPEQFRRVDEVFQTACTLDTAVRDAYLDEVCGDDPLVRAEVQALLAADDKPRDYLKTPNVDAGMHFKTLGGAAGAALAPPVPQRIASYRIIRPIGEGGFGVVYLAEQESPRRTVAVKVMKSRLASSATLRRFEYEAQVLGRLQHPGIAQIYEAGTHRTSEGVQAFFAMEYVDGRPIDVYSREKGLDVRARLELIARLCDAVQYAHQKGIIHRDLKPQNILVCDESAPVSSAPTLIERIVETRVEDGRPRRTTREHAPLRTYAAPAVGQPKILDFGVARTTDPSHRVTTLQTSTGQLIGTLPYMSPEQVAGDPAEVDTRSDVYGLGVILYELLTGSLPFDFKNTPVPEAARKIRDEEPPRLGTINRQYRGEVEVIAAKALQKDKSRRYQSASELGADIRRYLVGDPIEAKRDSTLYVLRKNLRRYRGAVIAASLFIILLSTFGIVSFVHSQQYKALAQRESRASRDARIALAAAEDATRRADATARRLAVELSAGNIERGRLHGVAGNLRVAEELIWPELLKNPGSLEARWALWELYSNQPIVQSLTDHSEPILAVAYSPDGDWLTTASRDGTIRIRDALSGEPRVTMRPPGQETSCIAYSLDGTLLFSGSADGYVRVWRTQDGELLATLGRHTGRVNTVTPLSDGAHLASGAADGLIRVWSVPERRELLAVQSDHRNIGTLRVRPGSATLASCGTDGRMRYWEFERSGSGAPGLRCTQTIQVSPMSVSTLAFSEQGALVAVAGEERWIYLFDAATGEKLNAFYAFNGPIRTLAFLPDGRLAATGSWRTDLWDALNGRRLTQFAVHISPASLSMTPDGTLLATAEGPVARIRETTPRAALRRAWTGGERALALGVSPDGRSFATGGGDDRRIRFWDIATLSETFVLNEEPERIITVRFSPDGRFMAYLVRGRAARVLALPRANKVADITGVSINGQPVAFHPNGRHLVVGRGNGTIVVHDLETQRAVKTLTAVGEQLWVAFSADGRYMATTGRETAIRLWDAQTYEPIAQLVVQGMGSPWGLSFSPDGDLLACGTWDKSVDLWDLRTRQRVASLAGHTALVTDVAFAPIRSRPILASASNDATLKLWDALGQRCLTTLESDSLDTYSVAFTRRPDAIGDDDISDYLLLSVNLRGMVDVWDLGHYDRHIAGNAQRWIEQQRRQAQSAAGDSATVDLLRELESRARRKPGRSMRTKLRRRGVRRFVHKSM